MANYTTIASPSEGVYKERGSKFLGYAFPVQHDDEVKLHLESLREMHPSARHVCYASILGLLGDAHRANDDGEPGGTAGLPILNQIRSKGLTYTMVAVVRYFGGTKLGVSGLIHAYKQAALEALDATEMVQKVPMGRIYLTFPHDSIGEVERIMRQHQFTGISKDFGMLCSWTLEVPLNALPEAQALLLAISGVNASIKNT